MSCRIGFDAVRCCLDVRRGDHDDGLGSEEAPQQQHRPPANREKEQLLLLLDHFERIIVGRNHDGYVR